MKVKNIAGTSNNPPTCDCDSWIDHWENYTKENRMRCHAKDCINPVEVGAHVQKSGSGDRTWHIVPFCKGHNNISPDTEIELKSDYQLAPAALLSSCK